MKQWSLVRIGDIVVPIVRQHAVTGTQSYKLLGIRLGGKGPFLREVRTGSEIAANMLNEVKAGDFIYSRLFAWQGAFGVISEKLDGCFVSGEFPTFRPILQKVDATFLNYWFRLPQVLRRVEVDCTGSTPLTRNRYKEQFFLNLEIPLPPLAEQRRIVGKIEGVAGKVEEARGLRALSVSSTNSLLRTRLDQVIRHLEESEGSVALETACVSITDGDHITPQFTEQGVKFIFVGNVSSGTLHFDGCKYVAPEYFARVSALRRPCRGDILYSAVGATLGIPALVDTDEEFCFQRHIAILKPNQTLILSRFLWYLLQSGRLFSTAWANTTGSAQPTVPLKAIRKLPIVLPPLGEQQRIVDELDHLLAKTNCLQQLQSQTAAELDALLPAVLDRAFRGEL